VEGDRVRVDYWEKRGPELYRRWEKKGWEAGFPRWQEVGEKGG